MNTDNSQILNNKYIQDFNRAIDIYENKYTHEELINLLKSGTIVEKQTSVLKLEQLKSQSDADVLMDNLVGCDGKIREAVSFKLKYFTKNNPEYFIKYADTFLEAIIDINGNICRNTISSISNLKTNKKFCNEFCKKLEEKTLPLSEKAKNFDIQNGKYKINKEIFKLYWYLETIYEFCEYINKASLEKILVNAKEVKDYTIREKAAKIISKQKSDKLNNIKKQLKQDENYYVRRF